MRAQLSEASALLYSTSHDVDAPNLLRQWWKQTQDSHINDIQQQQPQQQQPKDTVQPEVDTSIQPASEEATRNVSSSPVHFALDDLVCITSELTTNKLTVHTRRHGRIASFTVSYSKADQAFVFDCSVPIRDIDTVGNKYLHEHRLIRDFIRDVIWPVLDAMKLS